MKKGKQVAGLEREDLGIYIRWATGHNFQGYHNSLVSKGLRNPMCRLCRKAPETSSHLLFECTALEEIRTRYFGRHGHLHPPAIKVHTLLQFMRVLSETMEHTSDEPEIMDTDYPDSPEVRKDPDEGNAAD